MVFKRNRRSRRSRFSSVHTRHRGNTVMKTGPTTVALDRRIKNMERDIEVKRSLFNFADINEGLFSPSNALFYDLMQISKGDGENQRDGDSLRVTSIRGNVRLVARNEHLSTTTFRVLLVRDKQAQSTPVFTSHTTDTSVNNFWETTTAALSLFPDVQLYNSDNIKNRFRILYDKTVTIEPNTERIDPPAVYVFQSKTRTLHINVKKSFNVQYTDPGVSPSTNGVYLVLLGDLAFDVYGSFRVNYKDA